MKGLIIIIFRCGYFVFLEKSREAICIYFYLFVIIGLFSYD